MSENTAASLLRTPFREGEPVLIIDNRGKDHLVHLRAGSSSHHGRTGAVRHDDIIGQPPGLLISSSAGKEFICLRPTFEDFVFRKLRRQTQIIYPKDMGAILIRGDIFPGARVLEAGLGSGATAILLRRYLGPAGELISYEKRSEFVDQAQRTAEEFERHYGKLSAPHRIEIRDVYEGIDAEGLDTILLDVPMPQRALQGAARALRINGVLLCWLPTALQVFLLVRRLQRSPDWARIETSETMVRPWAVGPQSIRPVQRIVAHTGFLISARRVKRLEVGSDPTSEKDLS